jgi:hypothetical protein
MKNKVVVLVIALLLLTGIAFAGQQQNNNDNGGTEISTNVDVENRNVGINKNKQQQGQIQGQMQGQQQGQIANGEVSVTGDSTKVYANAWPSVTGAEGVSSGNAATIFGSLGLSQTEKYKKIMPQLQAVSALVKDGMITPEEGRAIVKPMVEKLVRTNKTQRLLGILWETDGRNLLNGFGILAWDSVWKDGPAQGVASEPKPVKAVKAAAPKTVDEGVTGNGGVLPGGIQK